MNTTTSLQQQLIDGKITFPKCDIADWGNGHTRETDPPMNGWRLKRSRGSEDLYILGNNDGRAVAASMRLLHPRDGRPSCWDVAIYSNTPKDVQQAILDEKASHLDPVYKDVGDTPGWTYAVVQMLNKRLQEDVEFNALIDKSIADTAADILAADILSDDYYDVSVSAGDCDARTVYGMYMQGNSR